MGWGGGKVRIKRRCYDRGAGLESALHSSATGVKEVLMLISLSE